MLTFPAVMLLALAILTLVCACWFWLLGPEHQKQIPSDLPAEDLTNNFVRAMQEEDEKSIYQ